MASALTQEQVDSFWQNSFVACGPVLEGGEVAALRTGYDRLFADAMEDGSFRHLAVDERLEAGPRNAAPALMAPFQPGFSAERVRSIRR